MFVQHLAPPGSEPAGRLQAGPRRVGMRSLGRLCCCHDKKRACTGSMNQLEKAHLPVKWLRGTATLTRCRGAVPQSTPQPKPYPQHLASIPSQDEDVQRSEKPPCCSCRVKMPKSCPCASARGQICIPGLKNRSTISSPDPSVIKHSSE